MASTRSRLHRAYVAFVGMVIARDASGQTQYFNLDAGKPGRVEDAEVAARYSLGVDLAPFQLERLTDGTFRIRGEPKVSYGVLPFTEIEARLPIVHVIPSRASGARPFTGVASFGVGVLHAFNLETSAVPAFALGGDVALPVGTLAGPHAAYVIRLLSTKTTSLGRVHVNAGIGTYAVRAVSAQSDTGACTGGDFRFSLPGQPTCSGKPPIIFDSPCSKSPSAHGQTLVASLMCMGVAAPSTPSAAPTHGSRWLAGIGADHAFALRSTLVTADIVAEHFVGLYSSVDWTAEAGIRRQMTPTIMIDAGVASHFAGVVHSTSITVGAAYEIATPPLFGGSHGP
jgi:hypothetical protein